MECYGHEGGAFYGDTVPVVGGHEGVEKTDGGPGEYFCHGKCSVWVDSWGCGCRDYNAAGCAEDEDDAGEGKAGYDTTADADS